MAARHLANGLAMALLLALCAGLVYVTVLISSESFGDDQRVKRSLLADNEYLFKNGLLHRVHWTKTTPSTLNSATSEESVNGNLPNPSRFDKKSPLEYIFISVKTATKFHLNRLQVIIDTWFNLAPDQVSPIVILLHLKVSKSRKPITRFSHTPKNQQHFVLNKIQGVPG